jgi:Tfp pilus assembly protein PilO
VKVTITPERAWTMAAIAAVGALVFLVLFDRFVDPPSPQRSARARFLERERLERDVAALNETTAATSAKVAQVLWDQNADIIGPTALSQINAFARARGVRLASFRPQQVATDGDLTRQPYLITLEGSFPNVMAFLRDVQAPEIKLAVHLVQMTAADGRSDIVNANIGVTAYRETQETNAPAKKN